jgi:hypothetical protein
MAQIDPNIALGFRMPQIQDPVAATARVQEIGVNALKMNELQRGVQEEQEIRNYLRDKNLFAPETRAGLSQFGKTGLSYGKLISEQEKAGLETKKLGGEISKQQLEQSRERTSNLAFNPSNENIIAHLQDSIKRGDMDETQAQGLWSQVKDLNPDQRKQAFLQLGASANERLKQITTPAIREFEFGKTNPEFAKSQLALKRAGAAQVVLPAQEKAFEAEIGKGQADAVLKSRATAEDAAAILQTNEIGRQILNSGAITGAGAEFFVGLNQALKTAGIDFGYADAAANSQAYAAAMGQNTAKLIKQFGAGTGLSDADREYATKIAGGSIKLDDKAIRKVLEINDRAARNVIAGHNKKVENIKTNIPLKVEVPGAVVSIKNNAEYNALPPGTVFIDPEGKQRRKP